MRHRTKTLQECSWVKLIKSTNPKTGKTVYTVRVDFWRRGWMRTEISEIREHFDPGKNRGSATGSTWRFKDRNTAEQLILTAILKWGG